VIGHPHYWRRAPFLPRRSTRAGGFFAIGLGHGSTGDDAEERLLLVDARKRFIMIFLRRIRHERAVVAAIAQFRAHIVEQQVAVDAGDFAEFLSVTIRAAYGGELLRSCT